jgi:dTDP-4-dehydrorhamnose reductase
MRKRTAILGASGILGSWLMRVLGGRQGEPGLLATGFTRTVPGLTRLDLGRPEELSRLIRSFSPELVFLTAALTSPLACERDKERAWAVNAAPAVLLARLAREMGFRLVFVSTDLVFDGTKGGYRETDRVNPLSVYGRTKAAAEEAVLEAVEKGADCLAVRTSLIIGWDLSGPAGNLAWMEGSIREGKSLRLYIDEFRSPVAAAELARCLSLLAQRAGPGLYHLAGPERMSRYGLGRLICQGLGWPLESLVPARLAEEEPDPPRPADVSLDLAKAGQVLGREMVRPLKETLAYSAAHPFEPTRG